ncbi:MAG: His/Gly/Thr/Pro-type tRNA ligase C-terminal domain-containing protein, partial [Acidobacteriota bacterium]
DAVPEALRLAAQLRREGIRVDVYPEPDKLGKQMKYAAGRLIPFAAICGGDELSRGEVTLKDLRSGQQSSVPRAEVAAALRRGPSA